MEKDQGKHLRDREMSPIGIQLKCPPSYDESRAQVTIDRSPMGVKMGCRKGEPGALTSTHGLTIQIFHTNIIRVASS